MGVWVSAGVCLLASIPRAALTQGAPPARLLVLQAEERRATTAADLSTIRVSARSGNPETARVAIRAFGRLERVSLIPDILPGLRHSLPEVRAEAANALAQAAQGLTGKAPVPQTDVPGVLASTQSALILRLDVETDANVRGALVEALARLPYRVASDAEHAEQAILELSTRATALADRLGLAKALEAFVRLQAPVRPPSVAVVAKLLDLVRADTARSKPDLLRDARVRRLALEGLTAAGAVDDRLVERAASDPDPQMRRLAMRAIAISGAGQASLHDGLIDPVGMVRLEALRAVRARDSEALCRTSFAAADDPDVAVALAAVDQLSACAQSEEAVAYLVRTVARVRDLAVPRGWHRNAHALVALAQAAPERSAPWLAPYAASPVWQVRLYAARAARQAGNRAVLETLAADADDRVANVALTGLDRPARPTALPQKAAHSTVTAEQFGRLAAPRALITIRDVGQVELALFASEAPGTVIRFAMLAEAGYYDGLSFDRLVPNATAQAGERTTGNTATFATRETGTWPHVRGTFGLAAPDTGDAQFFINLVDNPRFDHQYGVFAQILNGADVVDRLLEGDTIESITIVP
jgi:peptidyl-prolyl cis-trans isomerase B (cyclophilin B)